MTAPDALPVSTISQVPRVKVFQRSATPPTMRLTERDARILEAIHAFDGVLSDLQIKRLFFTGDTQMRLRMRLLFQHGYVARPDYRRRASLTTMVYWLDRKGAEYVAGLSGTPLTEFVYRTQPKWAQLDHDLSVNDFRITVMEACRQNPALSLEQWIPQSEFWAQPDRVDFRDTRGRRAVRYVRPDGYFIIQNAAHVFRFLLELDRATEDNPRFAREKVLPGIAYIKSRTYRERFGHDSGRWLVVTTSERRARNMKAQAERVAGRDARLFYFVPIAHVSPETLFTTPIWGQAGEDALQPLFHGT